MRAHGLRGQVVVALTTNRDGRLDPGARLWAGDLPLVVTASGVAPAGAGHDRWLVTFEGITSREAAERLRGRPLLAEAVEDPDVLWVHDLIGATVRDAGGTGRGVVTDVIANPASDLLVLDTGALVPLRFVTSRGDGVVTVEVPEGLWELGDDVAGPS